MKRGYPIGFVLLAVAMSVEGRGAGQADGRGQNSICDPLARAITNRSVRCNLGNWFDATQCKYASGQTMANSFLSVCRTCAGKTLPAKHPGYTNVRCENILAPLPNWPPYNNTVPPYVDAVNSKQGVVGPAPKVATPAPAPVATPVPVAANVGGHERPVAGPKPTASDCNGLRRALDSGRVFCTIVNLYDANYCKAADGKNVLLNSFITRCPSCRDKTPRHDGFRRCDAPEPVTSVAAAGPSSVRYIKGDDVSLKKALGQMVPGANGLFAQDILVDYHRLFKNPNAGEPLGIIAATFETQGYLYPLATVANDTGGTRSYGMWQINSASRMNEFLGMLSRGELPGSGVGRAQQRAIYDALVAGYGTRAEAVAGSGRAGTQFERNWRAVANNLRLADDFKEVQREYIRKTHFDPCRAALGKMHPNVTVINNPVIQENMWSASVQHGPGGVNSAKGCSVIISRSIAAALKSGHALSVLDVLRKIPGERTAFHPASKPRYTRESDVSHWVWQNI